MKLQIEGVNGRLRRSLEVLVRGKGYHVYRYVWDPSQKFFNHRWMFFREMPNQVPQFSGTNSVVQNNALLLLHGAMASNRLDIRGLLTISRYMWCYLDIFLVFLGLAIAFERTLFPSLPHRTLDRQLTFRGSEGSSDVVLCTI